MSVDFTDILNLLEGEQFEERPVSLEKFVTSEEYLGLAGLSAYQYKIARCMSQIYKLSSLQKLYGEEEGEKIYKNTMNEITLQLGKGSGKDFVSTVAVAYIVYLLLCLKDPAEYYGKPSGDAIDIINIAINSQQAKNVFFKGFKQRVERCPWFAGKFAIRNDAIEFDKSITVHSGHSEREAWEGYNVLVVILDEISGFALESTSGHEQAKTAQAIYDMYRASIDSRFPDFGKLVLLSFPRFKDDFIQQRYNEVIADKTEIVRERILKLDPELPDGIEGNEIKVEWTEDTDIVYKYPRMFALRRPTWEINPTRKIEDFTRAFFSDMTDALSRFACMPPDAVDAFFKSREKVEAAFTMNHPFFDDWRWREWVQPDPHKEYYVHVDLARKHDRCVVALAHVDSFKQIKIAGTLTEPAPFVIVDAIRWWTPTAQQSVDFAEVREYIRGLRQRGYNLRLVTFDRWESEDMINYLNSIGIKSERLSVAKSHYTDLAAVIGEERIKGPKIQLLIDELLQLRIMKNDKVDHPRKGGKDLADAVCGAVYNAIAHTKQDVNREVEIHTYDRFRDVEENVQQGAIVAPKRTMPPEIADWLNMQIL